MNRQQRIRETLLIPMLYLVPGIIVSFTTITVVEVPATELWASVLSLTLTAFLTLHLLDLSGDIARIEPSLPSLPSLLLSGVALASVLLFISIATRVFLVEVLNVPLTPRAAPLSDHSVAPVAVTFLAIVAAIAEEIVFRAFLIHRLRSLHFTPVFAVLLSATLFALGHFYQGIHGVAFSFIAGATLGFLWLARPGITRFAFAHSLYNATVLLISSPNLIPSSS